MQSEEKIPVWLDCDPGHDDACAIILAGHHPKLELLGISVRVLVCAGKLTTVQTVMGNQTVDKTTQNALKVTAVSGLEHIGTFYVWSTVLPLDLPDELSFLASTSYLPLLLASGHSRRYSHRSCWQPLGGLLFSLFCSDLQMS